MSTRDELVAGLKAVRDEMVARMKDPTTGRQDVMAAGFVAGWLDTEAIPRASGISDADLPIMEAETEIFLAGLRDEREKKHG